MAYSLDLSQPSISQAIGPEEADPATRKFVEVEVVHVVNPSRLPAIFEVHYQREDQEPLLLGTFSLFPPDNPGKFIVATRGLLRPEGKIVLSLVKPKDARAADTLRVDLAPIRLRQE